MTRWGILGPGRIAHKFVQDLLTLPDAQLYAVASSDQERANAFAQQYGAIHALGSYDDQLTLPDLDVVYVATPHVLHHENALLLLNRGVAVLGEKPFAMNSAQVNEMVDLARTKQVFLMEALWSRFMPVLDAPKPSSTTARSEPSPVFGPTSVLRPRFSPTVACTINSWGAALCSISVFIRFFSRT